MCVAQNPDGREMIASLALNAHLLGGGRPTRPPSRFERPPGEATALGEIVEFKLLGTCTDFSLSLVATVQLMCRVSKAKLLKITCK